MCLVLSISRATLRIRNLFPPYLQSGSADKNTFPPYPQSCSADKKPFYPYLQGRFADKRKRGFLSAQRLC